MLANDIYTSRGVKELLTLTHQRFTVKTNDERINEQELQYSFYTGSMDRIEETLNADLEVYYDTESKIIKILHSWLKITKKIIDSICVIYKEPAKRTVLVKGKVDEELTDYYNSMLPVGVNSIDKRANRLATLQGGSVSLLKFDKNKKRFKQSVYSGHFYNIINSFDDVHEIAGLSYSKEFLIGDVPQLVEVVWTEGEYYIRTSNGDLLPFGNNETKENEYEIIPAFTFSDKQNETFWSEGANDIVQANREINALLVKLTYDDLILGTAGHLFGTDLDNLTTSNVKSSARQEGVGSSRTNGNNVDPEEVVQTLKGGRQNVIIAKSTRNGSTPTLGYISTNPQVEAVFETISNKLKLVASTHGLNPDVFADVVRSTSGYSKTMDKLELLEIRQEDLDIAREYELDRFDTLRTMNNVHLSAEETEMEIPEDATLRVDFGEIKMPKTTAEEWMDVENKVKYDIINIYDVARKHNPDLKSDAEAKVSIEENKKINKEYKELTTVVSQNGLDDPKNNANNKKDGETPNV